MDIRMSQIVQSLLALRYTVHFLSHEDVHESQLSPFDSSVIVHTGSLTEQLEQARQGCQSNPSALLYDADHVCPPENARGR